MSTQEKVILADAEQFAHKYIFDNYGLDVDFTEHKFTPVDLDKSVGIHGHVKGDDDQKVFVLVKYDPLKVETLSLPEGTDKK
ncbi:hypothetical protein [Paenibacillus taichungensis]|uniref:hypothetical protein n=1 Tax=Paenibacillus taichungensis TaxID=484184 RepID=UPI0039A4A6A0